MDLVWTLCGILNALHLQKAEGVLKATVLQYPAQATVAGLLYMLQSPIGS